MTIIRYFVEVEGLLCRGTVLVRVRSMIHLQLEVRSMKNTKKIPPHPTYFLHQVRHVIFFSVRRWKIGAVPGHKALLGLEGLSQLSKSHVRFSRPAPP